MKFVTAIFQLLKFCLVAAGRIFAATWNALAAVINTVDGGDSDEPAPNETVHYDYRYGDVDRQQFRDGIYFGRPDNSK